MSQRDPSLSAAHATCTFPVGMHPAEVVEQTTYNGYRFRAEHAALVHVPELADNFEGLPRAHHRCRNFQFAVAMFGYPSAGGGARGR